MEDPRKKTMLRLRLKDRKSLREIGDMQDPPISPERVRQIIGNTPKKFQPIRTVRFVCERPACKKVRILGQHQYNKLKKRYCSRECRVKDSEFGIPSNHPDYIKMQSKKRWGNPEYRKQRKEYFSMKWHTDPEWRAKRQAEQKAYQAKRKKKGYVLRRQRAKEANRSSK